MNKYIKGVEVLPFSTWDGIQLSLVQVFLLFVLITTLYYWIENRNSNSFLFSLAMIMGILCLRAASFIRCERQEKLVVYNVPGLKAIDFIKGRDHIFWADQALSKNQLAYKFHIKPAQILFRLKEPKKTLPPHSSSNFIRFGSLHILYLDKNSWLPAEGQTLKVDILIVSGNNRQRPRTILECVRTRKIVFDGTNRFWKIKEWKELCDISGIQYHDVSTEGAFVMTAR